MSVRRCGYELNKSVATNIQNSQFWQINIGKFKDRDVVVFQAQFLKHSEIIGQTKRR